MNASSVILIILAAYIAAFLIALFAITIHAVTANITSESQQPENI